jgi:hypothetical protein
MNNTMNIQRVFSPISPTQRVHRLKKEHPDSKKRSFERDFEEEKDGEKNEKQGDPLEMAKTNDKRADPDADVKKHNNHGATIGALVDIRA